MSTVNIGNSTNNPVPVNVSTAIAAGGNTIGNVNIQASGSAIAFGQATMANSLPVVVASNQSNLPANITQISGSSVATAAAGIIKVGLTDGTGNAITSTSNAIDVNIKSGGGSGFSVVDETAWTAGTSAMVPAGGVFNDSAAALTSGQEGTVRVTNNRAIHVNLRDASANQLLGSKTSANSLPVVIASDQGAVAIGVASGTALVADQTNTILRTSLFVKKAANADTVLALGSATSANSLPVVVASDQGAISVAQSGTWTVQPGNTQNTTAWLTQDAADGPVSVGTAASKSILGGIVYNSSAPTPTNGQQMAIQADQAGNIRTFPGIALTTLSAWNSSTSLNTTQTIFTNSGSPAVLVQFDQTTTITAGAITFEANYDGTNWVTVPANCVLDPTSTTYAQLSNPYTLQASTNKPFIIDNNGWQQLRIRLSTAITGTGAVTPYYALLAYNPIEQAVVYSPTAANFQVTVGAALPAGGNTIGAVTQASGPWTSNITQIGGSSLALGQTTMSASLPVTLASNQSSLGVTLPSNNTTMIGVTSPGGTTTTAIAAAATNTVVKSGAGRLCRVLVTASGTAALTFYDNATGGSTSGNILGVIPANAGTGSVYDFQFLASTGIQAPGGANTPAVTVGYI